MSTDFVLALELVPRRFARPAFPAPELEREREVQLAAIRAQKDQLLPSAFKAARRALFGESGYGLDALAPNRASNGFRLPI